MFNNRLFRSPSNPSESKGRGVEAAASGVGDDMVQNSNMIRLAGSMDSVPWSNL